MKMRKKMFMFGLVALVLVFGSSIAQANTISGSLWHVDNLAAENAVLASVPGTTADVTFDVNSPFDFSGTNATVGTWLASSSAFNIVENTSGTLSSLMSNGSDDNSISTILKFTGQVTVTNGMTFTVTHDDGLTLVIGGVTVISKPDPTSPVTQTFTYTGPSGTLPFYLVYGECDAGPAELQISLPLSNVPLPPSALLLGSGLLGLVGLGWRRRKES